MPSAELGVAGKEADQGRNVSSSLWGGGVAEIPGRFQEDSENVDQSSGAKLRPGGTSLKNARIIVGTIGVIRISEREREVGGRQP